MVQQMKYKIYYQIREAIVFFMLHTRTSLFEKLKIINIPCQETKSGFCQKKLNQCFFQNTMPFLDSIIIIMHYHVLQHKKIYQNLDFSFISFTYLILSVTGYLFGIKSNAEFICRSTKMSLLLDHKLCVCADNVEVTVLVIEERVEAGQVGILKQGGNYIDGLGKIVSSQQLILVST